MGLRERQCLVCRRLATLHDAGRKHISPRLQSHGNQSRCHTRWHTGEQRRFSKKAQMGVGVDRNGCAKRGNWRLHSKNTKTRILHYQAL